MVPEEPDQHEQEHAKEVFLDSLGVGKSGQGSREPNLTRAMARQQAGTPRRTNTGD